jgi:hypothetical protein
MSKDWNIDHLEFIADLYARGKSWEEISDMLKEECNISKAADSCRKYYARNKNKLLGDENTIKQLREKRRAQVSKSRASKENRVIIDYLNKLEDIDTSLQNYIKNAKFTKPKVIKYSKSRRKGDMTMEVMLTDLHYGKKTEKFDNSVARERMKKMSNVVLGEIDRYDKIYNVEHILTFLGGDIIEGATIHGTESRIASDGPNSMQIDAAIESLYEDYIVPVVSKGRKCTFVCVTGNHDRDGKDKTFQNPGEEHFTYIIYKGLKRLCEVAKLKNVEFIIPKGVYHVHNIYGSKVLYEHGDRIKGGTSRNACESHMSKRSKQVKDLIDFARFGHWHERLEYGRGRVIFNASLPGQDSYAEINGYDSEASQTINYYVNTENRPNCFYHSFPVYLGD